MKKYLLGAAFLGVLAMTATGVSAAVVCNDEGDCWKVKDKYDYPPAAHLQIYGDDWKWEGNKYRWRDPGAGRGYWNKGVWSASNRSMRTGRSLRRASFFITRLRFKNPFAATDGRDA